MSAVRRIRRASVLMSALTFLSCKDTPTTTEQQTRVPASLAIVAGNEQQGVVGAELANPIVVRVEDANGLPIVGQLVNFRVTSGGGSVFAGSGLTNALGIVQDRWTLGTATADSQRVEARAVDPNTGARIVFATFKATPLPGPAQSITKTGGDAQTGALGAALTDSLAVRITDSFGNPVPGVTVTWAASAANGAVSPATSQTNAQGIAKTRWTLGARMDVPHVVTATVNALPPAAFGASATLPSTANIVKVGGDDASAVVGSPMAESLAVRVQLADGQVIPGAVVTWAIVSGGGTIAPQTSTTQSDGIARARLTLGVGAGVNWVTATVSNLTPAQFVITGTPDVPTFFAKVSGDGQQGTVGQLLPQPIAVVLQDRFGNPVPGSTVAWEIVAGGGTVTAASSVSDAHGQASVGWTLGSLVGTNQARVSFGALASLTFVAQARAGAPSALAIISGDGQTGVVGTQLPQPIVVRVTDTHGNAIANAGVNFSVTAGGGSVAPPATLTDATGDAHGTWTLGGQAGTQGVTASAIGTTPVSFTATATVGQAAAVAKVSGDAQSGTIGQPLAQPLVVRVTDANANPIAGAAVNWVVGTSCGSISTSVTTSDEAGNAQITWTLGLSGRSCAGGVTASIAGGASAQFTARFLGHAPQVIDPGNFVEQVGTIEVPVVLTASVTDSAENPVPNVTVNWSRSQGNGEVSTTSSVTDPFGRATVTLTPGTAAGDNRVRASVTGVTPVEYLVWTHALAPQRLVILNGNNQTGEVAQPLAQPIRVRVEDTYGNGVYDQPVTFQVTAGGGYVERTTSRTDPAGLASTVWIPGSAGGQEVRVTWNSSSVSFAATGVEGTREGLISVGGNEQVESTSQQVERFLDPISVRVVTGRGEPVSGAPVTFSSARGPRTVTSDAAGLATVENLSVQLLGVGTIALTASLPNGSVARLTVIVESGGGGGFGVPAGGGTARVGRRLPGRVTIRCSDRMGGVSACTWQALGQLIPAPGIFPRGHYEFFWILPTQPGTYSLTVFGQAGPNQITATAVP